MILSWFYHDSIMMLWCCCPSFPWICRHLFRGAAQHATCRSSAVICCRRYSVIGVGERSRRVGHLLRVVTMNRLVVAGVKRGTSDSTHDRMGFGVLLNSCYSWDPLPCTHTTPLRPTPRHPLWTLLSRSPLSPPILVTNGSFQGFTEKKKIS